MAPERELAAQEVRQPEPQSAAVPQIAPVTGSWTPADVVALSRTAGNAAVTRVIRGGLLQRQPAAPVVAPPAGPAAPPDPRAVAAETHRLRQVEAMTLDTFQAFTERQVDWASGAAFAADPARTAELRAVLVLANQTRFRATPSGGYRSQRPVLAACGPLPMRDLRAAVRDHHDEIEAYGQAVSQFGWEQAPSAAEAVRWGDVARKLTPVIGEEAMKRAIKQNHEAHNVTDLLARRAVDEFVEFCRQARPIMSATDGAEVGSYLLLRAEARNPLTYVGQVGPVRNLHHFTKASLDALKRNRADQSRTKPLAVVLHSGLDHDHAFHRDPNLSAVLTYRRRNTQLIEGAETLAEAQQLFTDMVSAYGRGTPPKAQAVMLAGHGDSRVTEMAGGTEQGDGTLSQEDVNLDGATAAASLTFIDTLIGGIDASDPAARIVLNGCLTNSISPFPPDSSAPPATGPRELVLGEIRAGRAPTAQMWSDAFTAGRSLADTIRDRGAPGGLASNQVSGARSSFGSEVALMNTRTGELGLRSRSDPNMTSADIYAYIATAGEADGAMRAALQALTEDPVRAERAMRLRLRSNTARTTWDDKLIKACFREVLVNPADVTFAYRVTRIAGGMSECQFSSTCRPWMIWNAPAAVLARVMSHLERDPEFTNQQPPFMKLVVYQVWHILDQTAGKAPRFLRALGTMTVATAKEFVALDRLRPLLAGLLPNPPSAQAAGELRLALLEVDEKGSDADPAAIDYLRRRRLNGAWANQRLITAALGGRGSPAEILDAIREPQPAAPPGGAAPPPRPYNLDVDADGTNDMYVTPMPSEGVNVSAAIGGAGPSPVFARPDAASAQLGTLAANARVNVIGQTEDHQWYVIEFGANRRPGFVRDVLPL
jgi:hypothetical protein